SASSPCAAESPRRARFACRSMTPRANTPLRAAQRRSSRTGSLNVRSVRSWQSRFRGRNDQSFGKSECERHGECDEHFAAAALEGMQLDLALEGCGLIVGESALIEVALRVRGARIALERLGTRRRLARRSDVGREPSGLRIETAHFGGSGIEPR